jgi:MFS family permease
VWLETSTADAMIRARARFQTSDGPMNLQPLRYRNFNLLWWAGLASLSGTWALRVALPLSVLDLTGSPAAVSAVVAAALLGTIIAGPVGGAYVDRWDRRRVVVTVNLLLGLAVLPLMLLRTTGQLWIAVAVAFLEAALNQFFQPAENALLPRLVPDEHLTAANALNGLNNNTGRLFGPALGGIVAASVGLRGAAMLDSATFLAAAALCALITGDYRPSRGPRRRLGRELVDGFVALGRHRIGRAIAVLFAVTSVGEGMMSTLFAVYVTGPLRADGRVMGALMSAQAIGGVAGSVLGSRYAARLRPVPLIAVSYTVFGVVDIAIFNYPRWGAALWPVIAGFAVVGVPVGVHVAVIWTLFQRVIPDAVRGRAFGAVWTGAAIASVGGAAIAGWLGGSVSVLTLLTIQGAGPIAGALLFRLIAGPGPAGERGRDRAASAGAALSGARAASAEVGGAPVPAGPGANNKRRRARLACEKRGDVSGSPNDRAPFAAGQPRRATDTSRPARRPR